MSGPPDASADIASPVAAGSRLRVCLVGPSLDILGGQAVQLQRLRERLSAVPDLDVRFIPVNPRLPGPLNALRRIKYVRTVVTSIAYIGALLARVRRADVVHAFSASYWSFLLAPFPAMLVGRLYGKGVILNYRSGEADDHLTRWRWTAAPLMRLAHQIVVPSQYLVEVFGRHGLPARPISNFVEFERIPFRARPAPRPVFLSNRNLEPLYNVRCTLRAFALVQQQLPEARLIVAGDGSERASLERLTAELGLQHVEFRGRTAPAAMAKLYDEADIYLNSPDIDNMPNSVIEAFAAGLPVVTTDAGGIPFVVRNGENGLMVPSGSHEQMAAAALRLLHEPGLAERLSGAARQECLSRYTWEAVRDEWDALYHEVASQAHGHLPGRATEGQRTAG